MRLTRAAVIDPVSASRRLLTAALRAAGFKVSVAEGPEAIKREQVVVFGPGARRAANAARALQKRSPRILVLSAQKALLRPSWAHAVVPLPVSPRDLKARLPELARLLDEAPSGFKQAGEGVLDPLTGFYTLAHFKEILFIEVKRARRYGLPLAGALVAVDAPGRGLSPQGWARMMGGLALAIRRSLRDTDYPVQYNADHVLLLMPHTDLAGAVVVSRRICDRVAHATLTEGEQVLRPTVSIGVSASAGTGGSFSFADLARNAQTSLEQAQEKGGNRVEFYDGSEDLTPLAGNIP